MLTWFPLLIGLIWTVCNVCPEEDPKTHNYYTCVAAGKKLAGRKKYPKSIFTLLAPRIYAITFARQARKEHAEVEIT